MSRCTSECTECTPDHTESDFILFFFIVVDFVIHWNETTMGLHVFPIPIHPPTSLSFNINYACMHAKSLQLCLTLCSPMECSLPGSSVQGILQARTLERVAMPSSMKSSQPRDQTQVFCIAGRSFAIWGKPSFSFHWWTNIDILWLLTKVCSLYWASLVAQQ